VRAAPSVLATCAAALTLVGGAAARGGDYHVEGGSAFHRAQVRAALEASSFDWNAVPAHVTVHIAPGAAPTAAPGHIWLDPRLLDAGIFSWAVVQDEYAHQVDYFLLGEAQRRLLNGLLGTEVWYRSERPGLRHAAYGSERFTSTFVWAYWPVAANSYRPRSAADEAAAMDPVRFRRILPALIAGGGMPELWVAARAD
jgi:hypothetical protein